MRRETTSRPARTGTLIALLVVAAAVPVVAVTAGPEAEPNDRPEEAQEVALGAEVTGELTGGDVDWFRFTAERGTAITVSGSTDGVGTTNVELVDRYGNQLDGASGLSNQSASAGATGTYTGTYYVRVERRFTDRGGEYSLTVETAGTDGFEPNEGPANATALADEEEVTGELTQSDGDWFNVTAERGDVIGIAGYADGNGTTNVQLHARNGTILAGQDGVSDGVARFNATAPYTGAYSVRVAPRFEETYGATYNLTVDLPGDPPSNADESGDGGGTGDDSSGGLPVVPVVAGLVVLVALVVLVVAVRFRDEDESP